LTILPLQSETPSPKTAHAVQSLAHFARVVRYRKVVLLGTLAVSGLLGSLYYATAPRLYQAKASLLVLQTGADVTNTAMSPEGIRQGLMPTYERLFSSNVVLEGALQYLQPAEKVDFESSSADRWVGILRGNLTATTLRQTNIIEVSYRSKSPSAAVAIVNAVVRAYLDFMDKTHKGTAGQIIEVITREKGQLEERLAAKEHEVLDMRRRFGDLGIRSGGTVLHPTVQRAINLNEALMKCQQKRIELQASKGSLLAAVARGEDLQPHLLALEDTIGREFLMAGFGLGQRDIETQSQLEKTLLESQSQLKTLQVYYGPAHPRVVAVQDRIRATSQYLAEYQQRANQKLAGVRDRQLGPLLTRMVEQRLSETWQHETTLRQSFEQARAEAVNLNGEMARLEILEHDLHWLRDLRDVMLNQIASVDLRQDHGDIRTAVVSEPSLPRSPVSPKLSFVAGCCLLGGLLGGLALIYALDALDDHFRSPEEMRSQLGVNLLAMVRDMPANAAEGLAGLQAYIAPTALESEAFRTLRTTLALGARETNRLVISSAEPGDGKTTVLANLAVSYAQSGKRVLMIDADMRRPGLTKLFELKGCSGLSDALISSAPLHAEGVAGIQSLPLPGLDILPAGTRRPDSAELLAGPRLAELLSWAEGRYDQILIDSPPALAASDASIIARLVDGLVLVVQPKKSQRRMVVHAVEGFAALGVNVLGVVVNRIASEQEDSLYGFGFGYGYEYGDEESASSAKANQESANQETANNEEQALRMSVAQYASPSQPRQAA